MRTALYWIVGFSAVQVILLLALVIAVTSGVTVHIEL
jgi:hypothetical protein